MKFSDLSILGRETFLKSVVAAFYSRAEELGWAFKAFNEATGMATFEHKEKARETQINLSKMLADIIFYDRERPELGEAPLTPATVSQALDARLAILNAFGRYENEQDLRKELRKVGKSFGGRLRYWKLKASEGEDLEPGEIMESKEPVLWLEDGEEVQ